MTCEHKDWLGPCREPAVWRVDARTPLGSETSHWCRDHLGHHIDDVSVPGQVAYGASLVREEEDK